MSSCVAYWQMQLTDPIRDNQARFSQQVGMGGQSYAYDSCRAWLGLSFESLTAIVRSKFDSGGHVACCSGTLVSAPDGT